MRLPLTILLIVFASTGLARDAYYLGHDLNQMCKGYAEGFTMGDMRQFKCDAYLSGYLDRHNGYTEEDRLHADWCVSDRISIPDLAKAITDFYARHPEYLDEPATKAIEEVFSSSYPCR